MGRFTLTSRFWTKKSLSNQNLPYIMLKISFPFLYASTSPDTNTFTIASDHNFETVCQFVVLLLSTFCGFSIFATLLNIVLSSLHVCNGLLFPRNLDPSSLTSGNLDPLSLTPGGPIVPLICGFRRWAISWCGVSCLWTFISDLILRGLQPLCASL